MKIYKFKMSAFLKNRIFQPCRSRDQVIRNLIETVRELLISQPTDKDADLVVVRAKFQRVFYISENKIYSTNFPFNVVTAENRPTTVMLDDEIEITNKLLSGADSVINAHFSNSYSDFDSFFTSMMEELEIDERLWLLLKSIFMLEDSYIRYDIDPKHADDGNGEKKLSLDEQGKPFITHPLHHIDVFYSPEQTFKIGLKSKINYEILLDIIDSKTKCRMLSDYT